MCVSNPLDHRDAAAPAALLERQSRDYARVAEAIGFIRERVTVQPGLDEIAAAVGMSPGHLQRLFSAWAGVSPKRFLQSLTRARVRQALGRTDSLLEISDDLGLSSVSRLHDLMVSCEALTPGEIRSGGAGLALRCGVAASPFGPALIVWSPRGICELAFNDELAVIAPGEDEAGGGCRDTDRHAVKGRHSHSHSHAGTVQDVGDLVVTDVARRWPAATVARDDAGAWSWLAKIFPSAPVPGRLHLLLRGTNFQIQVWEALLRIAPGETVSYGALASRIGSPRAARAVGSAVAANTVAYLIPCHRVIRESGETGQYRWGSVRKQAMLGWEAVRTAP